MASGSTIVTRATSAAAAGLIGCATLAVPTSAGEGNSPNSTVFTCANPASGASWQLAVDYVRNTVDAHPAKISHGEISWFDPTDGSANTLNRATGYLTASIASSTGGYFRYARCRPKTEQ
jgi:hypothetical protein